MKTSLFLLALSATSSFSQGPLTPPGAPAPTQKSLQQIWDKIGALEATVTSQKNQITQLQASLSVVASSSNQSWNVSEIDAGASASLAFAPDGHPAIAFLSGGFVYYSKFDGVAWSPRGSFLGRCIDTLSLAFAPDGHPSIAYIDGNTNGYLKLLKFNGTTWVDSLLNTVPSRKPSLAYGPDGQPAIAYYDAFDADLEFISRHPVLLTWTNTTLSFFGLVGNYPSLVFAPDGRPSISYHDHTNNLVLYTKFNGTNWDTAVPDAASGGNPSLFVEPNTSLAYGPDGQPSVAYYNAATGDLRFSKFNGSAWLNSTVESVGDVGAGCSLAYGPDGQPSIAYTDRTNRAAKFAKFTGTSWAIREVSPTFTDASDNSLKYSPTGQAHLAFRFFGATLSNPDNRFNSVRVARLGAWIPAP